MAKGNRQHEIRTDGQPETPGGLPAQGTGDTDETTDSGGIQRHQDHDMEGEQGLRTRRARRHATGIGKRRLSIHRGSSQRQLSQ